jgi:N-acetylmuramic acid 6-phosphate etherase
MVNLVADNAKLRDRAARIVGAVAGVDPAAARAALDASGGRVKPAILVARGLAPAEADAVLAAAGGHLARAMT